MLNKEIYLTEEEQIQLKEIVRKGVHNAHVITRARVLLMLDRTGKSDHVRYKRTAEYAQISVKFYYNLTKRSRRGIIVGKLREGIFS